MKFVERIKKDKDFRWKAILVFVVAVFLVGNMTDTKKEAVSQAACNEANIVKVDLEFGTGSACGWTSYAINQIGSDSCMPRDFPDFRKPDDIAVEKCAANLCKIGTESVTGPNIYGCFACVPLGVRTASKENCCSKEAESIDDGGTYKFLCKSSGLDDPNTPRPGAVCKNDAERTLAGFLDSAEFADGFTCKQKYYLMAFGGGFLTLIFILVSL